MSFCGYTLIDHEGKLAAQLPWQVDYKEPRRVHVLYVSNIRADVWRPLVGKHLDGEAGYYKVWNDNDQPIAVNMTGWELVQLYEPVKPPRNGREYGWKWSYGQWVQDPFPHCTECYHHHDPSYTYCDDCGHCKPASHKHRAA